MIQAAVSADYNLTGGAIHLVKRPVKGRLPFLSTRSITG